MRAVPDTIENEGAQRMAEIVDNGARERLAKVEARCDSHDRNLDEIWRAIDAFRELASQNAMDSRDLMLKIDVAVETMKQQGIAAAGATAVLTDLTRRIAAVEQERADEKAEEDRRRKILMTVFAPLGGVAGSLLLIAAQTMLSKFFPGLFGK